MVTSLPMLWKVADERRLQRTKRSGRAVCRDVTESMSLILSVTYYFAFCPVTLLSHFTIESMMNMEMIQTMTNTDQVTQSEMFL